ncbi:hypothetical protein KNE206_52270 [Kitasatospora sp. NE20-6]|uniref:hypothetical protein n=1 Tax=Kitasatospora sp. NE20-6 TaxID=2859066 RepID=UPI0034DC64F4
MPDARDIHLRFRTLAVLPIVLFLPTLVSFAVAEHGVVWPEYTGVLFHLAILFLIARMEAPVWAKAAGYSWITLDVLTGILAINGVAHDLTWPIRLGGHVFAGIWIAVSSAFAHRPVIRILGALTGVWLAGYSFVGNVAPEEALYPAGLLIVVWFGALALRYESTVRPPDTAADLHLLDARRIPDHP